MAPFSRKPQPLFPSVLLLPQLELLSLRSPAASLQTDLWTHLAPPFSSSCPVSEAVLLYHVVWVIHAVVSLLFLHCPPSAQPVVSRSPPFPPGLPFRVFPWPLCSVHQPGVSLQHLHSHSHSLPPSGLLAVPTHCPAVHTQPLTSVEPAGPPGLSTLCCSLCNCFQFPGFFDYVFSPSIIFLLLPALSCSAQSLPSPCCGTPWGVGGPWCPQCSLQLMPFPPFTAY